MVKIGNMETCTGKDRTKNEQIEVVLERLTEEPFRTKIENEMVTKTDFMYLRSVSEGLK